MHVEGLEMDVMFYNYWSLRLYAEALGPSVYLFYNSREIIVVQCIISELLPLLNHLETFSAGRVE